MTANQIVGTLLETDYSPKQFVPKEPWQMTRKEFDSTEYIVIPAWKQNANEVFIAGAHEPFAKSEEYFDEHGYFVSRHIPDFAWDLDMERAESSPHYAELYRPMSEGVFVSMRELDAAGGDIFSAMTAKRGLK